MEKIKRYSGVIVKCNDEVLLCKRNFEGSLPGQWSIPAGKLNKTEAPLDGAKREFFEETNIDISNEKLKLVGFINRTTRDGSANKGLMYVFLHECNEKINPDLKNAKDGDEHLGCEYFSFENLPMKDDKDQLKILIKNILRKK